MTAASPGRRVRALTGLDLAAAGELHAAELPQGFLAQLGPRFLSRYLSTFLDTPGAVALAVDGDDGRFQGFLVGTTRAGHHRAALQQHGRMLLLAALASLVSRPSVLLLLLRTRAVPYALAWVRARRQAPDPVAPDRAGGRTAVLLHVAVSPGSRGQGAGAALVVGLQDAARAAGCEVAELVSFGDKAKGLYERLGWERHPSQTTRGQVAVRYRRAL